MQEPTSKGTTGWTVETLFVYFSTMLEGMEKKNYQRFLDQEKAVLTAESNAEKWRSNANEWRAAMSDRERNFATVQRVEAVEKSLDRIEGASAGIKSGWAYLVGAVGALAAIISIFYMRK